MLIIGGRSALKENDTGTLQDIDQMALMQPITKWARICHHTERIPFYVAMAFRQALSGRPGPVYLELPMDIPFAKVDEKKVEYPKNYRTEARPAGDPAVVAQIRAHPDVDQVLPQNNVEIMVSNVGGVFFYLRLIGLQEGDTAGVLDRCGTALIEGQLPQPYTNGVAVLLLLM